MKWFKHFSNSGNDPEMETARALYGSDAYYFFYKTMEIYAENFDVSEQKNLDNSEQNIVKIPYKIYKNKVNLSSQKITKLFDYFSQKHIKFYSLSSAREGLYIILKCPKLNHLADEWTQRKLGKNSRVTPECNSRVTPECNSGVGGGKTIEDLRRPIEDREDGEEPDSGVNSTVRNTPSSYFLILKEEGYEALDNPVFRRTLEKWCEYLKEKKLALPVGTQIRAQLDFAKKYGALLALQCINSAIAGGWTGWCKDDLVMDLQKVEQERNRAEEELSPVERMTRNLLLKQAQKLEKAERSPKDE